MSTDKAMARREEWLEFWEGREAPFLRALPYVLLLEIESEPDGGTPICAAVPAATLGAGT